MKTRWLLFLYSFGVIMVLMTSSLSLNAQTYKVTAYSGGASGTPTLADVIGIYVQSGTYNSYPMYKKISGTNTNPSYVFNSLGFWTFYSSVQDVDYWYYWTDVTIPATFPIGTAGASWSSGGSSSPSLEPTTTQNATASMTLTNGSSYAVPSGTRGTSNNPVGRFLLKGGNEGGVLQGLTIALSGTRTGVSNVKLWSSTSTTFASATLLATVATDNTSITFSSFNSLVDYSAGTYYFVSVDIAAGATGSVTATIPSQASFTFAGATVPSSFTNAALSSGAAPLPVELMAFSALQKDAAAQLSWATATEVNNYGFAVERRQIVNGQSSAADWRKISFVAGSGTSATAHSYSYTDASVASGTYAYRLKQIDNDGTYKYSSEAEVTVAVAKAFTLNQNYPNPFNPTTTFSFTLPQDGLTILKVYNVLGEEVATLVNSEMKAGVRNTVSFDASRLSSGVYFARLENNGNVQMKKILLMK
jgi:hypothetical protein